MTETTKTTKPKAETPAPDAPRVSAALDAYPLSDAIVERAIVRGDGSRELRVIIPAETPAAE